MTSRNIFCTCLLASAVALSSACGSSPVTDPDAGGGGEDAGPRPDAGPPACPTGTERCGDACVDTSSSRSNCGECGTACAAGEVCADGTCDVVCPASQVECDGACADTSSDRRHCGDCGTACATGEICVDGACEVSCPGDQVACGDACVDLSSNPAHCSACDAACDPGAVCSESACSSTCATGLAECGAACVDTDSDPDHCGACDDACPSAPGATGYCVASACRLACDPLDGDCNADLADGCETPLGTDPANCGACARVCVLPNAVTGCAAGACTLASCDAGFGDCDGIPDNGCETDTSYDDFSCGACGTVCGSGDTCVAGTCRTTIGETCSDAIALSLGANTVTWDATSSDVLTAPPACSTTTLDGPDVVFSYTSPSAAYVTITFTKPTSQRWVAVTTVGACGRSVRPDACAWNFSDAAMSSSVFVDAGETVYVVLSDTTSGSMPLDNPLTVTVSSTVPPCAPGAGGILGGGARTPVPTGLASFTEYYVAADQSPTGYVYVGGTVDLYRIRKDGSSVQDVADVAALTGTHLGYGMLIDGANIYTIDSTTTGTTAILWRISSDGGATWSVQDYAVFPTAPLDDFRAATVHGGRIYLVTEEDTAGTATQIWSVDAAATTLPTTATLELSITTEGDCSAITRDASFYYLACDDGGDRIVRVPVAGGTPVLVTSALPVSATNNELHGDDTDADGVFDVLYVHADTNDVGFVCGPTGATPFAATLADLGGATTNYGLGFDRAGGVLWTYDDDSRELVSVE